jgi:hypothetical protein
MTCCAYSCTQYGLDFFALLSFSFDSHSCSLSNKIFKAAGTIICVLQNCPRTAKCRVKYSVEVVDVLNCYVLIILSKTAPSIPTIKSPSTRRINAVSVDVINACEEVEREFHAFLISEIHTDKRSCLKPGRSISEGSDALPNKWETGWAPGPVSTSWRKERFFPSENQNTIPWSSSPEPSHCTN